MSLSVCIRSAAYRRRTVLQNLSFEAESGTVTAVIGRNGSGKSTLVSCLCSLMPYDGTVMCGGVDLASLSGRERAQRRSAVLQLLRAPHVTVRELVAFGRSPYRSPGQLLTAGDAERIDHALQRADLVSLQDSYADCISGGELRRAYLGSVIAQDTDTVILDEATAFMDADYQHRFMEMVCAFAKEEGKTVISVMHDLGAAVRYADRILLLHEGRQLFFGDVQALLETDLIERTFGVRRFTADGRIFFA